ncbi:MAG: DinB family protein [Nevskia sp.]|nr:DinB family protein [Nevskia sp.]
MIDPAYCSLLARYNQWMNRKLYQSCGELTEAQCKQDVGAFFGSIQATLNHLLYADTIWTRRFTGRPLDGLHARMEFHPDLSALRAMRDIFDQEIIDWAGKVAQPWLAADFSYTRQADGVAVTRPAWVLVTHMFNHQTHHRGQITTMLKQFGLDPGVTDLAAMPL